MGNQQDVRHVLLEHIKCNISHEDPDNVLARGPDIYKMLAWIPGTISVPTEAEWKVIMYSMYPRGYRDSSRMSLETQRILPRL